MKPKPILFNILFYIPEKSPNEKRKPMKKKRDRKKKKETKTILNIIEYAQSPRRHERW